MVTTEQYNFLKEQYDEESIREDILTKRAQIYLSINSFVITAFLFKVKDLVEVVKGLDNLVIYPLILSFILILISCVFIFTSLQIKEYEFPTSSDTLTVEFDNNINNRQFIDNRAVDLVVATDTNRGVNDIKAAKLTQALKFIIGGYISSFVFITLTVLL